MTYIDTTYYETRQDVVLNTTDFPTTALVNDWIAVAELEINKDLKRTFDVGAKSHTIKAMQLKQYTDIIFLPDTPISAVSVTYNSGDDFNEVMTAVDSVVLDADTGMVRLKNGVQQQKVVATYTGGFATIPVDVQKLSYLIVVREKTDTELKQELGDDTTTSISSIRVSERSSTGLQSKLDRLDKQIQDLKDKLGSCFFIGMY